MRRIVVLLVLFLVLSAPVVFVPGSAHAAQIFNHTCASGQVADDTNVCHDIQTQEKDNATKTPTNPIISIIKVVITVMSIIVGAASVISILVGSLKMITSNGDPQAISSAKSAIAYALIGVATVALAQIIVVFVISKVA